jgi:dTDP-4-amino-4,6-dideoxygalactose transaminase
MYYILASDLDARSKLIGTLKQQGIGAVFHYVPLHSAPAGQRFGRAHGNMDVTNDISDRLLRLPLWVGLDDRIDDVITALGAALDAGKTT